MTENIYVGIEREQKKFAKLSILLESKDRWLESVLFGMTLSVISSPN